MKIYKCTVEARNSCYLETLLVVAENIKKADILVKENQENKYVVYKQKLAEINVDFTKPQVVNYFGWGDNSDRGYDSDD